MNPSTNISPEPVYSIIEKPSRSKREDFTSQNEIWKYIGDGIVILWMHSGIHTGFIEGGKLRWPFRHPDQDLDWQKHLLELRAFSPTREWRIWRSADGPLRGRKREDFDEADPENQIDDVSTLDTYMQLRAVVAVPSRKEAAGDALRLHARHYLTPNAHGPMAYSDMRFVGILENNNSTNQQERSDQNG